MKKWYLSTPMNGKTEKEIQAALQRGIRKEGESMKKIKVLIVLFIMVVLLAGCVIVRM